MRNVEEKEAMDEEKERRGETEKVLWEKKREGLYGGDSTVWSFIRLGRSHGGSVPVVTVWYSLLVCMVWYIVFGTKWALLANIPIKMKG